MKKKDEKRRIIKVRPFNMANFSGGSGYLIFSLIYQAFAILPAALIIWAISLIKLPKNEDGETDVYRAGKRFYAVAIPFSVILIVIAAVLAVITNYGTFLEYWFEIFIITFAPTLCAFFIIRHFHLRVVSGAKVLPSILISLGLIVAALIALLLLCAFVIDPILTDISL